MAAPDSTPLPKAPPPSGAPRPRHAANAFIALFLAYQIGMPLSYYVGDRMNDERFGWRMFSTLRLQKCDLLVEETTASDGVARPVVLGSELHVAWINLLKRGWPIVVERYLTTRCASGDLAEVSLERRCLGTDGSGLPPERTALACGTDHVRTGGAAK